MHLFTAISPPPPISSSPASVMWDGRCVGTDSPASTPMNAVDEREREALLGVRIVSYIYFPAHLMKLKVSILLSMGTHFPLTL